MLFGSKRNKDADPAERALWGQLLNLGMIFPISILLGFFLGRWVGRRFGHEELGQWIGLTWGVAGAFWELYKVTIRLDRLDQAQQSKGNKDQDEKDHHEP